MKISFFSRPFHILFSFLFFLSCAGCAGRPSQLVFEMIPTGKTLSSNSRFLIIDDFNAGSQKGKFGTRLGTEWKPSPNTRLRADRSDAIKYGGSLSFEFDFSSKNPAVIETSLNGLDASQAQFLVFMLRRKEFNDFRGTIEVSLRDLTGKEATVGIHSSLLRWWTGPTDQWVQAVIPKAKFKDLDFNQLDRFKILLKSGSKQQNGKLIFDEIAFFGNEELVFNSEKDNLLGFPEIDVNETRRSELLAIKDDQQFLREIARDTWLYFENLVDRNTHLVVDHARAGSTLGIGSYISPTNLALYWLVNVAAYDLSLISKEKAIQNIKLSFDSFEKMDRWKSRFWYNFYHTGTLKVTRKYISTVDNGWLAAGLIVIRSAFPEEFGTKASEILKKLDFSEFYDISNGQLKLGFDDEKGRFAPYHYGLLATEARLTSYIAIGKGDVEEEHWARIFRTLPLEWDWQKQVPEGQDSQLFGVNVFEGHYSFLGKKFIPSWGGSLFEFLAPTLLVDEQKLAKENLGMNNEIVTDLHIQYALKEQKYPIWGLAPCAVRNGKYWIYREYGIPQMGAKGYSDRGVIAPYASFLALATRPKEAIKNFRQMLLQYPDSYGEYGFYDSIDVTKGIVNHQYLALDQALSFLAIVNYLENGSLRRRFQTDPIGKKVEMLLKEEKFSIGQIENERRN